MTKLRGGYYTFSLGQALQGIKVLKDASSILGTLKWNWAYIVPEQADFTEPYKYSKGKTLTLRTKIPPVFANQFSEIIKTKCNEFIGIEAVLGVKFVSN